MFLKNIVMTVDSISIVREFKYYKNFLFPNYCVVKLIELDQFFDLKQEKLICAYFF